MSNKREFTPTHEINNNGETTRSIMLAGTRWFNGRCGNTYHITRVYLNGRLLWQSPVTYGYGSQYEDTGWKYLQAIGIVPHDENNRRRFCESHGIVFESSGTDVARKKDL